MRDLHCTTSLRTKLATGLAVMLMLAHVGHVRAQERTGEQIYVQNCAVCHGDRGQGTPEHYATPLVGDRPLADLTKVIHETMPEGNPELVVGKDAELVARYVYDAFYSEIAQARNQPARIELSRLTARQYAVTIADLFASFHGYAELGELDGLRGQYYNSRRHQPDKRVIERVDKVVSFNWDKSSPDPEQIGLEEFAIRWNGSLFAPETGEYELIVETENGARLWLNDDRVPLIDAGVKSGNETVYKQSIRLLGGRVYPLRLDYFKSKEPTASIRLKWKRPHQAAELIPQRNLSTKGVPETFVLQTNFPPDDRSVGYERGNAVSKAWDAATTHAALEIATHVAERLKTYAGFEEGKDGNKARVEEFLLKFVERAFRRPLDDENKKFFIHRHFTDATESEADIQLATKKVIVLALKSPRFLYPHSASPKPDSYDVATRLALGLWDSLPDDELLAAAAAGKLEHRDEVTRQADRMRKDLRTRSKMREFLHVWLKLDQLHSLSKDSQQYPDFSDEIVTDLRTSLDIFLEETVWSDTSDFRQLLLADHIYLNGRLAQFYGAELPEDAPFQPTTVDAQERAGVLTHPYLMAGFAYTSTSSPIHRGVFLARGILGRMIKPPPEAFTPITPDLHPNLNTRERVALQTSEASCQVCHSLINPLGFSLEKFDPVGRLRSEEKGRPIDATGGYLTVQGETVNFQGARELAVFLANSSEVHESFVEQLFRHMAKQPVQAYPPETLAELTKSFAQRNFHVANLLVETAVEVALGPLEISE